MGERGLVGAVLSLAIMDSMSETGQFYCPQNSIIGRMSYVNSAREWIDSDCIAPYSYIWCCEILGINFKAVRKELIRMRENNERFFFPDSGYRLGGGLTISKNRRIRDDTR